MSANMTQTRWPVSITLDAPLHHGAFGADTGNAVLHRRVPLAAFPSHPGVPAVSGNALRGNMRRIVMRDLLERVALSRDQAGTQFTLKQWDMLYAGIANGGHLKGESENRTDPDRMRAIRDALPPLSVFGAALYTFMISGRVSIGWLWPVCEETVRAGLTVGTAAHTGEELITEISLVRHVDREYQDPTISGVTPMPVTVEALVPGTTLQGEIICMKRMTDVERGCLAWSLNRVQSLGGKGGVGFGRLSVNHNLSEEPYTAFLADPARIDQARSMLVDLARSFV